MLIFPKPTRNRDLFNSIVCLKAGRWSIQCVPSCHYVVWYRFSDVKSNNGWLKVWKYQIAPSSSALRKVHEAQFFFVFSKIKTEMKRKSKIINNSMNNKYHLSCVYHRRWRRLFNTSISMYFFFSPGSSLLICVRYADQTIRFIDKSKTLWEKSCLPKWKDIENERETKSQRIFRLFVIQHMWMLCGFLPSFSPIRFDLDINHVKRALLNSYTRHFFSPSSSWLLLFSYTLMNWWMNEQTEH